MHETAIITKEEGNIWEGVGAHRGDGRGREMGRNSGNAVCITNV